MRTTALAVLLFLAAPAAPTPASTADDERAIREALVAMWDALEGYARYVHPDPYTAVP